MIHCFDGEENCELSGSYTGLHSWNDAASCQSSDSIVTIGIRSIITNRSGKRGIGKLTGGGTYPVDWGLRDMAIICKPSCITGRLGALLYLSIIC